MKAITKEAKDVRVGDVLLLAGIQQHEVFAVTPVGREGGYVEISSRQPGKPENVSVAQMPARAPVKILVSF
ncbi:hypothetical protein [Paraburkholderia sp. BR14320]|uniref:hypothetical protein n=1 Tax=unclassified Paraburkholderia TaxID=2615204 RepID=UPI0034CEADE3